MSAPRDSPVGCRSGSRRESLAATVQILSPATNSKAFNRLKPQRFRLFCHPAKDLENTRECPSIFLFFEPQGHKMGTMFFA